MSKTSFVITIAVSIIFLHIHHSWAEDLSWRGKEVSRQEQIAVWQAIKKIAKREGVNPRLLASISIAESGDLNPRLRGRDGEYGFMQVMPHQSARINGHPHDLWDMEKQITAAARHIKEQNKILSSPAILKSARRHPVLKRHHLYNPRWLTTIGYNWGAIGYQLEKFGAKASIPASSIQYAIRVRKIYKTLDRR